MATTRKLLTDARSAARTASALAKILYRPWSADRAQDLVRERLAQRGPRFLAMADRMIWSFPDSPFFRLLTWAEWSASRLRDAAERWGLDDTLRALRDDGVYVSYDEYRGRTPIRRRGHEMLCREDDFDAPMIFAAYEARTGGTRSAGSRVFATFENLLANRSFARLMTLEAHGLMDIPIVLWQSRQVTLSWWLGLAHAGRRPWKWYLPGAARDAAMPANVGRIIALARLMARARGLNLPPPEQRPLSAIDDVLDAILDARAQRGRCVVVTTASSATRLAALAAQRGAGLRGVTFIVAGEPLTPGKYGDITQSGADLTSRYATAEAGSLGEGCPHPDAIDDMHFLSDAFGLVTHPATLPNGETVTGLLLTSLLPESVKVMLNLEIDDFADVTIRRCGCMWDRLGLRTHISGIRSFSKMTGEGMTLLGTDCVRILEEVLPREFGGSSTDYQLLEREDEQHLTGLCLVVSPRVGPIDEERLLSRFHEALSAVPHPGTHVPSLWRQAGTLRVLRSDPVPTPTGKLLPFHTQALGGTHGAGDGGGDDGPRPAAPRSPAARGERTPLGL
jgi:hypothetical protein